MKIKKAFSDLKINLGRTLLVIVALILGTWGVGSIIVSNTILTNDLNKNFLDTLPAHVTLASKDFNRLDIDAFRSRPEIESAEFRDKSLLRIEVYPDDWITLFLFGVEDFNHFNLAQFYQQKGEKVPLPGTMLIERDGLLISDLNIGKQPRIRSGGKVLKVPISGVNFDPAQAPATQDHFIYAYVDKKTYTTISGEPSHQRLIFRIKNAKTKKEIESVTDKILTDFKATGIRVQSVDIPQLNEHPHQWQLNTLLFIMEVIGVLAFLMGAVLVTQLMSAILASQVRQIGILKAIGASRFDIFQIYLVMLLVFGIVSGIIAIPLAVSTGYAFSRFVAGIINFDILTTTLPYQLYFYLAAASLLLPVILSLPIILKGLNGSVLEAISDYGIRQDSPKLGLRLGSAPLKSHFPKTLLLALRNSFRKKARLAVTILAMSLGVAIFSTGFNVRQSIYNLLSSFKNTLRYDVQVVLREPIRREQIPPLFGSIGNIKRIEGWNGGRGELQSQVSRTSDGIGIISVPANTELLKLDIVEGRWLKKAAETEIVINQQSSEILHHPKINETVVLNIKGKQMKAKLVGVAQEFEKSKIYIDEDKYDLFANPDHLVNSITFVAKDNSYDKVISLKKELERTVASSDLNVLYVMSQAERVKIIYDHLQIILVTVLFLALLVLIISTLGMTSATSINIMERTREIGVMRAIGATPKMIYSIFVTEGMIVSAASIVLGLLLAWPISVVASYFFGNLMLGEEAVLRYSFSITGFWVTLGTTLVFSWLASRFPARKAISVSTCEALAYE